LHSKEVAISARAELFLFAAARAQLTSEVIRPLLDEGTYVICDRYADSTVAYQSYGRGLGLRDVAAVNRLATDGLVPDLTLLFDLPPEVGLARNRQSEAEADRLELEELAFHRCVREGYLEIAKADGSRWVIIDATVPADQVWEKVLETVAPRV
jgi:dTMP kinase